MSDQLESAAPTVSVVMPVYNARKALPGSLGSVLSQSFQSFEVLLCEDGSTDGSLELCREFAKQDARVRVFTQENAGPAAARNMGLPHMRGTYALFCDSDDFLRPGAMAALVAAAERDGSDLCIGRFHVLMGGSDREHGLIPGARTLSRREFLLALLKRPGSFYFSALWNKLYRVDIIQSNGLAFDETLTWGEDSAFNMRYNAFVEVASIVDAAVYDYVRHMSGFTAKTTLRFIRGIKNKHVIYKLFKQLYIDEGMYAEYKWQVEKYIMNVTMNE